MNNQKQRVAIAEACGWRDIADWKAAGINGKHPTEPWIEVIPDYLNDLNAMHEAEKTLNELQLVAYSDKLYDLAVEHQRKTGKWCYLSMSASQRAEAFLRTIGEWEEA